jgi:plastocyanin
MLKLVVDDRRVRVMLALVAVLVAFSSVAALASPKPKQAKLTDHSIKPGKITIKKGTKVTWKWTGYLEHNVTVRKGPVKFHSKNMVFGSYSHRFRKKGTYHLYCTLHPNTMKETVVVR